MVLPTMIRRSFRILLMVAYPVAPTLGQELVLNGGFEEFRRCPGRLFEETTRELRNVDAAKGSPGFFHRCSDQMGTPSNWAGNLAPFEGDGYTGLVLTAQGGGDCNAREFIQLKLQESLVNGFKYRVSFKVAAAGRSGFVTDRVGLRFSTVDRARRGVNDLLGFPPDLTNAPGRFISDTTEWVSVEGIYNARGGERFLVIGNFQTCNRTPRKPMPGKDGRPSRRPQAGQQDEVPSIAPEITFRMKEMVKQAYAYIDAVSVTPLEGFEPPVILSNDMACAKDLGPAATWDELIPDPGFDLNIPAYRAKWKKANGGTPDLYRGYVGIYVYASMDPDHREYIRTDLKEPMDPCGIYQIRMRVKRNPKYGYAADNIAIAFLDTFVMERSRSVLLHPESWRTPKGHVMEDTKGWQVLCGEFRSQGRASIMVLGNFTRDEGTVVMRMNPRAGPFAYYYIDDVSLQRTGTVEGCTHDYGDSGVPSWSAELKRLAQEVAWPVRVMFGVAQHLPEQELDDIASTMLKMLALDPNIRFRIAGHTDASGTEKTNRDLSTRRAEAVRKELEGLGVPGTALSVTVHGSSEPLGDNRTPQGRALNRRVDIWYLGRE
jgi:outer membrane protein OmpA-like peptidoglycan-associated protein